MRPHGWKIHDRSEYGDFLVSAAGAVPGSIARLIGQCRVEVVPALGAEGLTSEWEESRGGIEVRLCRHELDPHDLALEFLFCLGQAVWQAVSDDARDAWVDVLQAELDAGVEGEMDQDVLAAKQALQRAPEDRELLEAYLLDSFAATVAEYIHTAWHDTELREGPDHLPGTAFDARMLWMARLFGGDAPEESE